MGSVLMRRGMLPVLLLAVAGCAATRPISPRITTAPAGNFQLVEAVADPEPNVGRLVRWGGEVLEVVRDAAGNREVIVLERRLGEDGRPMYKGPSDGRFVIRATPGVDPSLYRVGTDITVAGSFAGMVSPASAASPGPLPLVTVTDVENWGYGGWYPDPYYYPPYYYGPYYGPYRHRPHYHGPRVHLGFGFHRGVHRRHRGYPYW